MPLNFKDETKSVFSLELGDDFIYPAHMATHEIRNQYYINLIEALDSVSDVDDLERFTTYYMRDLKFIGHFKNTSVRKMLDEKKLEIFCRQNWLE